MCWAVSEDDNNSFPNKFWVRRPLCPALSERWNEAPIHHRLDTACLAFRPFLSPLLPLKSGSSVAGVCFQFLLFFATWGFLMLKQDKAPLRSHTLRRRRRRRRPQQLRLPPCRATLGQIQSQRCEKCAVLPLCLVEPLLWLVQAISSLPDLWVWTHTPRASIPVLVSGKMEQCWEAQRIPQPCGSCPSCWAQELAARGLNSLRRPFVGQSVLTRQGTGLLALQQGWPKAKVFFFYFETTSERIYMRIFFSFSFPSKHLCLQQCLSKAQLVHKCLCSAWLVPAIPSGDSGHAVSHSAQHGEEEWNLVQRPGEAASNAWGVERGSAHLEAPKCVWNLVFWWVASQQKVRESLALPSLLF